MRDFFLLILVLLLASCEKTPLPIPGCQVDFPVFPASDSCYDYPNSTNPTGMGYDYVSPDTMRYCPSFNPENSDEMIYFQRTQVKEGNWTYYKGEIWLINTCTGKTSFVAGNVIAQNPPKFGKNDWILFGDNKAQIWKVRKDATGLALLGSSPGSFIFNHTFTWNPDGETFTFIRRDANGAFAIVSDLNGNFLDTIPELVHASIFEWSANGQKIATHYFDHSQRRSGLAIIDSHTREIDWLVSGSFPGFPEIGSIAWHPDGEAVYWTQHTAIYLTDLGTRETIRIKESCKSLGYGCLSVSPFSRKLAATRLDSKVLVPYDTAYLEARISVMDLDGSSERRVVIK